MTRRGRVVTTVGRIAHGLVIVATVASVAWLNKIAVGQPPMADLVDWQAFADAPYVREE